MANIVQIKRSSVAGKQPNVSDLQVGELALNFADGLIYSKNTTGNIVVVGASTNYSNVKANVTVSASAPSSNQIGDVWINSDTGKEYLWFNDGSSYQWVEENGSLYITAQITEVAGITSGTVSNAQIAASITSTGLLNTSNVSEGANLYFTSARVYSNVQTLSFATNAQIAPLITLANVTNSALSNITVSGNIVAGNVQTVSGTITANAATSFIAGDAAISGVALQMPREGALRNLTNGLTNMYFDVSIGGTTHGQFQFRSSNGFNNVLTMSPTAFNVSTDATVTARTPSLGRLPWNSALDTELTIDDMRFRISNQGGIFPQVIGNGSSRNLAWTVVAARSGSAVTQTGSTGTIVSSSAWTSLYTSAGMDSAGDTYTATLQDKAAGRIYRITFMRSDNGSTTGYNIIAERIL